MKIGKEKLLWMYERMRLIREFEQHLHEDFAAGNIPGFVHLYAGEEAVAVGVCANLADEDASDMAGKQSRERGPYAARSAEVAGRESVVERQLSYRGAINETLRLEMRRDPAVVLLGEHSVFAHFPGLKVVTPATPADAKGLLAASIRDDDPVIFCENLMLYDVEGPVPEDGYVIPLGQAQLRRQGADVTIVAISRMVDVALQAADELAQDGISTEVVDPRTLRGYRKRSDCPLCRRRAAKQRGTGTPNLHTD